jgi:hypothetical protein
MAGKSSASRHRKKNSAVSGIDAHFQYPSNNRNFPRAIPWGQHQIWLMIPGRTIGVVLVRTDEARTVQRIQAWLNFG